MRRDLAPQTNPYGIERLNLYGGRLCLRQAELAAFRGKDPQTVVGDYMIDTRTILPPFEDTVTLAANAARPLLTEDLLSEIGLLVVGTEGGLDFGKPVSTLVHEALGLGPSVRNFEVKHACYSGVAAMNVALDWIGAGSHKGKKALVIAADASREHFGEDHEFVLGGGAAAMIVSEDPQVMAFERASRGTWTANVYDTWRPTAREEVGNNRVSLFTYLDALEGAFEDFVGEDPEGFPFHQTFARNVYHMPFPGMAFQAHRALVNLTARHSKAEVQESFQTRVEPSLSYAQQLGSQYGSSNFVGLCGLLDHDSGIGAGDRIGFFAYGSGAIGEFYTGRVGSKAAENIGAMDIGDRLAARRVITPQEYERLETLRREATEAADYTPTLDGLYEDQYAGQDLLVLDNVTGFQRSYRWS